MTDTSRLAAARIKHGNDFPYDDYDSGRKRRRGDWAEQAARGVLADLMDRSRIKHGFYDIDQEIRREIVVSMAAIIRLARIEGEK